MTDLNVTASGGGLKVVAYPGDNKILLAMSLDEAPSQLPGKNLAGFAIWRTLQGGEEKPLYNRIGFTAGVDKTTAAITAVRRPARPWARGRTVDVLVDMEFLPRSSSGG